MKRTLLITLLALLLGIGGKGLRIVVLTPTPEMHCVSCENKIKENMRFEKGVKKIETNREKQEVSITYDPSKTNVQNIRAGMKKIGYETKVVVDKEAKTR
ncbi:MAG: heavy-metal-associated domain-containing protein [Bacteroidales bacterium]|nr:heavy-metal-associated domain-containing protein [Bacteroidales bacterium]